MARDEAQCLGSKQLRRRHAFDERQRSEDGPSSFHVRQNGREEGRRLVRRRQTPSRRLAELERTEWRGPPFLRLFLNRTISSPAGRFGSFSESGGKHWSTETSISPRQTSREFRNFSRRRTIVDAGRIVVFLDAAVRSDDYEVIGEPFHDEARRSSLWKRRVRCLAALSSNRV